MKSDDLHQHTEDIHFSNPENVFLTVLSGLKLLQKKTQETYVRVYENNFHCTLWAQVEVAHE